MFDSDVSLSANGNTLAVGALGESSATTGINGDQIYSLALRSGAVFIFTRSGGDRQQQAYVKASNTGADQFYSEAVSLSADGNTLAVSISHEDGSATGINGDQSSDSVQD